MLKHGDLPEGMTRLEHLNILKIDHNRLISVQHPVGNTSYARCRQIVRTIASIILSSPKQLWSFDLAIPCPSQRMIELQWRGVSWVTYMPWTGVINGAQFTLKQSQWRHIYEIATWEGNTECRSQWEARSRKEGLSLEVQIDYPHPVECPHTAPYKILKWINKSREREIRRVEPLENAVLQRLQRALESRLPLDVCMQTQTIKQVWEQRGMLTQYQVWTWYRLSTRSLNFWHEHAHLEEYTGDRYTYLFWDNEVAQRCMDT